MVNKELEALWQEYKTLYRSGGDRAEEFYRSNIFAKVIEQWDKTPKVNGFAASVHTLGKSPETVVLAARKLAAKRVYVLYTKDTEEHLKMLSTQVDAVIHPYEVDAVDLARIYKIVKEIAERHHGEQLAFDPTGGTKAMTAGLSAAAFTLRGIGFDVSVFYIETRYEREDRLPRPIPGTEKLTALKDPLEELGELDAQKARTLFRNGNYS
nr:TIGR02710 family CRISPR-associated protein [Deinococcota bacterium]